jgi:hypothetical protein
MIPFMLSSVNQVPHSVLFLAPLFKIMRMHPTQADWVFGLGMVLLFPTYMSFTISLFRMKLMLGSLLFTGLLLAAYGVIAHFFPIVNKWMMMIIPWPVALGVAVVVVIAIYHAARWLGGFYRDRGTYRIATESSAINRQIIADDFSMFQTPLYRRAYVAWLGDLQSPPRGDWPSERPNIKGDQASTMLAQLDERWLGLDS